MKLSRVLIIAFLVVFAAGGISADEIGRKGLVLGLGLGYCPVANSSLHGSAAETDEHGFAGNVFIGYAFDDENVLVLMRDFVLFSATLIDGSRATLSQGFTGIAYFLYMGPRGKSFFTTFGWGLQHLSQWAGDFGNDQETGALVGVGYEFTPYLQLYCSASFGTTSNPFVSYDHTQILFTVTLVAY